MSTLSKKIGLFCACLHGLGFIAVILCINRSTDPQAPLLWGVFAIIDFPISLIYLIFGEGYARWISTFGESSLTRILYLPYLVHGWLGTIWWYFLPRLLTPRKFGGVWGRSGDDVDVSV